MADIKTRLGRRIAQLRREAGLSQAALADSLGMSRAYLGELERGEKAASVETLDRLARGIGVPAFKLLQFDEGTSPAPPGPAERLGHLATALARAASPADLDRFERVMRGYFGPSPRTKPAKQAGGRPRRRT